MILHDNLNPTREISIAADKILTATPWGSGAAVSMMNGQVIGVYESPEAVEQLRQEELQQMQEEADAVKDKEPPR